MNKDSGTARMDGMNQLAKMLRWWWLNLIILLVASGAAFLYAGQFVKPVYEAQSILFLGKHGADALRWTDLAVNGHVVRDLEGIAKSRLVAEDMIRQFNLDMDAEAFGRSVKVNGVSRSRLISVSFSCTDGQSAASVANRLAKVILDRASHMVEVSNVRILEEAVPPTKPIKPEMATIIGAAALLGLMGSLFLSFLLSSADRTFRQPEDVENHLGLSVIGTIPLLGAKREKSEGGTLNQNLITVQDPLSPASESYRALRTNIFSQSKDKAMKTILVTSPSLQDGKSTTAANLAVSMAQAGKAVLLMDADLRNPKLHEYFGVSNTDGIRNSKAHEDDIRSMLIQIHEVRNLCLLTSGVMPSSQADHIDYERMKEILLKLSGQFDAIIIDSPPVNHMAQTLSLLGLADGILLVVSSGKTQIESARKTIRRLDAVLGRIIGVSVVRLHDKHQSLKYYSKFRDIG